MQLDGKVAIVTGAGAGIGRASAAALAEAGAYVILAERDPAAGRTVEAELTAKGLGARFVETDVSDEASMAAMVADAIAERGRIDVLYNNAGGSTPRDGRVTDIPLSEFWDRIRVDLFGVWLGCHYVLPHMVRQGSGSVINATSVLALRGTLAKSAYTTAKGGVIALTQTMARDYAADNIRVNAVAPGLTLTDRVRTLMGDGILARSSAAERAYLGPAEPEDVAGAVLFLASDASRKITGQVLPIDGGFTMS